jgi:hypothetical protein
MAYIILTIVGVAALLPVKKDWRQKKQIIFVCSIIFVGTLVYVLISRTTSDLFGSGLSGLCIGHIAACPGHNAVCLGRNVTGIYGFIDRQSKC